MSVNLTITVDAPVGTVSLFAGASPPPGWVLADGNELNRVTYADLFLVIGVTYGTGNGTTTFNTPNGAGALGTIGPSIWCIKA